MCAASKRRHDPATFVLGAGASRAVSYARTRDVLSPLDRDFFDLLQRLEPQEKDEEAVGLGAGKDGDSSVRISAFPREGILYAAFTKLFAEKAVRRRQEREEAIVSHFARAVVALLRKAHGTNTCDNHKYALQALVHVMPSCRLTTTSLSRERSVSTPREFELDFPLPYIVSSATMRPSRFPKTEKTRERQLGFKQQAIQGSDRGLG